MPAANKLAEHVARDPEKDSDRARGLAAAKAKGVEPGVDPKTGQRGAISYRTLFNKFDGDEAKAREVHNALKQAGGYGDVPDHQDLDIRGLERSVKENQVLADRAEDLYGRHKAEQQAQHQDNLLNDVREILEREGLNK